MLCFLLIEVSSWINIVQSIKVKNAVRVWDETAKKVDAMYMSWNNEIKSNIIANIQFDYLIENDTIFIPL